MVFANTIAYKIFRVAFDRKDIKQEYPSQAEKQVAYDAFLKWGLRKEHFKNIAFRNLSESVLAENIMLAQILRKEKARKPIVEFLLNNVHGEEVQIVPDLDIWEQENNFGMDAPEYVTLYEDDEFLVKVAEQKTKNKHMYMRIFHKRR